MNPPNTIASDTLVEAIARALHEADARHFAIAYRGPIPEYYIARAQAALTAITEAGYAVVPVEPTNAMLMRAIETLAASRHLIGKYAPDHHWLPEHDQRIAELRAATNNGKAE